MTPAVSICLVTYNRAESLPATLDSLLRQTFEDFELIISDDCSTDDTEAICRGYAARDARIRYRRNSSNLNMPGNLNAVLQEAKGVYLANVHDGDVFHANLIARWKEALDFHPSAGFVFNAYQVRQWDGSITTFREDYPPLIPGLDLGKRLLSRSDSCVYGMVMARRKVYEHLGWFDPQFGNFSDIDMWLRIARDYDVAYVDEPLMTLMPRDPTRFYAFVHWRVVFWILGTHTTNLRRYSCVLPDLTSNLAGTYRHRRRRYFFDHLLACIRKGRWDRLHEGLAILRDTDDWALRLPGLVLGRPTNVPDWYSPQYWSMAGLAALPISAEGPWKGALSRDA